MPVPIVDFDNQADNLLPLKQRLPMWKLFAQALVSQVKRLYQIFIAYSNGETVPAYNNGVTYVSGAFVQYNFSTWESIASANTGNKPNISPNAWILRNNSFIGASERILYNGRYLNLTYELNKEFGTTFRQPPYPAPYDNDLGGGVFSDIYITEFAPSHPTLLWGSTNAGSGIIGDTKSAGVITATEVLTAKTSYLFLINIPVSVFNSLGSSTVVRTSVVSQFVNQFLTAGTNFQIQTY